MASATTASPSVPSTPSAMTAIADRKVLPNMAVAVDGGSRSALVM
jgi:hypothetical protein